MSSTFSEPQRVVESRSFPDLPAAVVSRRLERAPALMVNQLSARIEATVLRLAKSPSAHDFLALRKELYPKYARLRIAVNNFITAEEPDRKVLHELSQEALTEHEKLASSKRSVDLIGVNGRDEALFCLSTLKRIYKLLDRVYAVDPPDQCKAEDAQFGSEFSSYMLWATLHLDCLLVAFRHKVALVPEVTSEILAGLRGIVMAYSCVRHGVELREPELTVDLSRVQWDDEDQALAAQSTIERDSTLSGW